MFKNRYTLVKTTALIGIISTCLLSSLTAYSQAEEIQDEKTTSEVIHRIKAYTATYNILHDTKVVGKGTRKLSYSENGNATYSYNSNIEWLIFSDQRSESSEIKFKGNHIIPLKYTYERTGTGSDKFYQWEFDVENNRALNLKNNKSLSIEFPDNIQDKLSYHFQNRLNLLNNPKQDHYVYPVISTSGKISNYVYEYDGEEELILPFGIVQTVRLKREVISKERVTYAWFAPKHDYLLVKIYQAKGDVEQFEAQLTTLTIDE